jgi:drug/metabolite transporter (DMT)-like permease
MLAPTLARPVARPLLGVAMVAVSSILFAFNGTVSKLLLRSGFDPPQLTALRAAGAFLGLLVVLLTLPGGRRRLRLRRVELGRISWYGLAGFFAVPMLYFVTISRMPVGIGLLFEYTAPFFVALWVRFGRRQPVKPRLWVGLVLCLGGLASVAQLWGGKLSLDPIGVASGLTCAVLLGCYYLTGSRAVADRDPTSLTCWAFGVAALAGAVVRPWWQFPGHLLGESTSGGPVWLLVCYLIIFGSIVPYLLVSASLQHLPPTSAGIIGMIEPVAAAVVAWIALDEVLNTAQLLGGALVLTGVVLAETARTAGPHGPPEIPPA